MSLFIVSFFGTFAEITPYMTTTIDTPVPVQQDTAAAASFYEERMRLIGVTPENNRIEISDPEAEFPQPDTAVWPIFAEDKTTGDILISYYTVGGEAIRYLHMGDGKTAALNAKTKYYETRRLKEPKGDMKYQMPAGQPTLPWFPPELVQKYKDGTEVPTLILTEGVFKAWCGSRAGLDIVGLPSVTCYKDKDGKLYSDIRLLIERCRVQTLLILWDGDCLNISRKDLQVGDELTNRPKMFFSSAKKIAELAQKIEYKQTREKVSVVFAHVRPDSLPERPKGLDDLLIAASDEQRRRIVQELATQPDKPFFFYIKNITSGTGNLYKYFRLEDEKSFYDFHRDIIESREFKFHGSIFRWSEANDALEMQAPEWANRVKWVGDEFFLEDIIPGAFGEVRKLIPYKQGQFTKMFGNNFWTFLQHHRAFVNIPDHFNYQQVIEKPDGAKYYNRYFPYPHVPAEGSWGTIMKLLLHIFGTDEVVHGITGKKYAPVELALDYIQLLLIAPTQMLPVLCLYSPENNTGKSTLGKLLMAMFGDNAIPIGNNELQSEFNDTFVDKLLAVCDETLLERKRDAERIKALSTSEKITVNPKGMKQYTIDSFCKFVFTSNNLRMIYVSKHDQRYWIVQVPVITEENPNMLSEMKAEIPAFTYHLKNRKLATEKEGRMWFHHSLIKTRILKEMVQVNEPGDATNMRSQLREWFIQDETIKELRMTLKEIKSEFFTERTSVAWMQEILRDFIGVDLVRDKKSGKALFERGKYPKYEKFINSDGEEDIRMVMKTYRGNPYAFPREQFLNEWEVQYEQYHQNKGEVGATLFIGQKNEPAPAEQPPIPDDLPF